MLLLTWELYLILHVIHWSLESSSPSHMVEDSVLTSVTNQVCAGSHSSAVGQLVLECLNISMVSTNPWTLAVSSGVWYYPASNLKPSQQRSPFVSKTYKNDGKREITPQMQTRSHKKRRKLLNKICIWETTVCHLQWSNTQNCANFVHMCEDSGTCGHVCTRNKWEFTELIIQWMHQVLNGYNRWVSILTGNRTYWEKKNNGMFHTAYYQSNFKRNETHKAGIQKSLMQPHIKYLLA